MSNSRNHLSMDPDWGSLRYYHDNDEVSISGSMSNIHPNNSNNRSATSYGSNALDPELIPCTQPYFGNPGRNSAFASHHSVPRLDMSIASLYPDIFPSPAESVLGGTDYGWYPNNSLQQANYMDGLGSAHGTGMMSGGFSGTVFNTMGHDNNNNDGHDPTVTLPRSFFNGNAQVFNDMHLTAPVSTTPVYDHAQTFNFGHSATFDPTLTIPTSAIPNSMSIPAVAPIAPPLTPIETIFSIGTPTIVTGYGSNCDTPAPDHFEPETSTSAGKSRRSQKRVYRTSYDNHASHRYTCHPCRFSTDVKRDFSRHKETDKHKKKTLPGVVEQEEGQERHGEMQQEQDGKRTRQMR